MARSGQFSAPIRACSARAPSTSADDDLAVAEVVGGEDVGCQHVAAAVADAQIGIDTHLHDDASPRVLIRSVQPQHRDARGGQTTEILCSGSCGPACWHRCVCVALAATACSSSGGHNGSAPASPTTTAPAYRLDDTLRLDQVQVLGSHNSYHGRPYPQVLAALYKSNPALARTLDYAHAPLPKQFDIGVRQIELDVWYDPRGGKYARPSFPIQEGVRIPNNPVMNEPGYKIIHQSDLDTNSTCLTFVLCLRLVRTWSDAHPGHVPIDVHIEMKDDKATEPMFQELEHEILLGVRSHADHHAR